jgi:hypothetical protein
MKEKGPHIGTTVGVRLFLLDSGCRTLRLNMTTWWLMPAALVDATLCRLEWMCGALLSLAANPPSSTLCRLEWVCGARLFDRNVQLARGIRIHNVARVDV